MSTNNIVTKSYKRLVIQIAQNKITYAVFDNISQGVKEVIEEALDFDSPIEIQLQNALQELINLKVNYDQIKILHDNNLNSFVPKALFDKDKLGIYLQYNTKVFESDFFAYDTLGDFEMVNIHVPYVHINNALLDIFPAFEYKNANTVLVEKVIHLSKNKFEKEVYIHIQKGHFEMVVVDNLKLLLYNSFDYKTPEDFIYYILFNLEQLGLNPENIKTFVLGDFEVDDPNFQIAYKYIRHISPLDVHNQQLFNGLDNKDNLKYFTLLHA
ncbi:MAG: DUF3822 family protein [Flavobacterium sp.]|nr:DUF3822 family protein [Candidatus Neoflavobacterium equi]